MVEHKQSHSQLGAHQGSPFSGCVFESDGLISVPVVGGAVHSPVVPLVPFVLTVTKRTHLLVVRERGGEEVAVEELLCLEVLQPNNTATPDRSPAHKRRAHRGDEIFTAALVMYLCHFRGRD